NQSNIRENVFQNYYSLTKLVENIQSNLTNIVNSGSKGSYSEGLSAKELFIHSKSGRAGIISTSLNTSSTGYLQRELVKCMEDLTTDSNGIVRDYKNNEIYYYPFATNTPDIDDSFLEYAFSMSIKETEK
ncbi:hypothetical protein PIROE2DRAFT_7984, partial [Piromyces sp. E2]